MTKPKLNLLEKGKRLRAEANAFPLGYVAEVLRREKANREAQQIRQAVKDSLRGMN